MKIYSVEKRGSKKFMVIEVEGDKKTDLKSFTTKGVAELHIKRMMEEQEKAAKQTNPTTANPTTEAPPAQTPPAQTPPEPPKEKRISGSDFVMFYFLEHGPETTKEEVRAALNKAELKMADSMLDTWPPFMKKIFKKLDELGWKRPE
jgi:hypothetical protein